MWPRILFELLPHLARLLPTTDKLLANRGANDNSRELERSEALATLAGGLRGELNQVSEAHAGIYRQLREQSAQVAQVSVEVTRTRMGVESMEARLTKLEKTTALAVKLFTAIVVVVAVGVGALILLAVILLHK